MQPPDNFHNLIERFLNEVKHIDMLEVPFYGMERNDIAALFIKSRKYDMKRALQLYKDHLAMRKSEDLFAINPLDNGIRKELISGKFSILRSNNNSPHIAIFRECLGYRSYSWNNYKDPIKSFIFQLDIAVRDSSIQENGLILIYNMSQASYNKFDFDLCARVLKLLKGKYPARLKSVLIMNAPIWFKAPYNVLKLFVSEKMRKRILFVDNKSIQNHVSPDLLSLINSNNIQGDHENWLRYCFDTYELSDRIPYDYFTQTIPLTGSRNITSSTATSVKSSTNALQAWTNRLTRRMSMPFSGNSPTHTHVNLSRIHASFTGTTMSTNNLLKHRFRRVSDTPIGVNNDNNDDTENNYINGDGNITNNNNKSLFQSNLPGRKISEFIYFMKSLNSFDLIGQEFMYEFANYTNENRKYFEFSLPKNKSKNRYTDVVCLDNYRVPLSNNSYIHANYVDSYLQKNAYICCQGPLESTIHDFYQMIIETKSPVVVMTTKEYEGKIKKCASYLPSIEDPVRHFGDFQVHYVDSHVPLESNETYYRITQVKITKNDISHQFYHYHFLNWPDFGIPENPRDFVNFIEVVHNQYNSIIGTEEYGEYESELETFYLSENKPLPPPIIVHCSAGIGRSGTFINVSMNMKWAKYEGKVNLKETLKLIRTQRAGAVQMPQQYIFCHIALLFYLENYC